MMIGSRSGLRVFGLCAMVLGMMALGASGAQAEVGANWKVNGKNVTGSEEFKLAALLENEDAALLTTLLGNAVKVLCKTIELGNLKLQKEGTLSKGGEAVFNGCETFLNGVLAANCTPKALGVPEAIITKPFVGLLVLVGGVGEALIKAASGTVLTVIESTEKCAIGQKITIEGELILKDCGGTLGTEQVSHLAEADNVQSSLTANGKPATLDGSAFISIAGGGGVKWSGAPA